MPKSKRQIRGVAKVVPARRDLFAWAFLLPVALVVILNLPSLNLGYFWDDYYFLTSKGAGDPSLYLLPQAGAAFYRPVSQGIYFLVLRLLDPSNGFLGHLLNLSALAAATVLMVKLVTRLYGSRAGLFSGLVFASYGHTPSLVAWISCSQDLLAILFVLAAFLLRDRGKDGAAWACATVALLCKEPALAAFPVLVLWDRILGREPRRQGAQLIAYGSVGLLWALVHPGLHLLAGRGFQSGATGYVGFEHPERWGLYFARYVASMLNLPPPGLTWSWWEERATYGVVALLVMVSGLLYLDRSAGRGSKAASLSRIAIIAALFSLPALLLPTILVRHWAPYFSCIPALGAAMLLGPILSRWKRPVAVAVLAMFMILGGWYRGVRGNRELVWSEPVFVEAARSVRVVRDHFKKVLPTIPSGTQVVASVGTTGARGIQSTLLEGQALRVWYRDPTIRTVSTLKRKPGAAADLLVRVTTELDVITIDPETHRVRASMPGAPDLAEINRPLNNYARALAAGGETDRAVRVLDGLAGIEPGAPAAYDRRVIASVYLAAGRHREADSLLTITPSFPREDALQIVKRLMGEATTSERLDEAAFEAFGLSLEDPETLRWMMRELRRDGSLAQAAWYAERLQKVVPGDPESADMLRTATRSGVKPAREAV